MAEVCQRTFILAAAFATTSVHSAESLIISWRLFRIRCKSCGDSPVLPSGESVVQYASASTSQ
jgi:hypothetical protein